MYLTKCDKPDFHNRAVLVMSAIIKHIMASTFKSELVTLFYGCIEAIPLCSAFKEMEHPQPSLTLVTTDNSMAVGLTVKTMLPKASKAMDMCFQGLKYHHAQQLFHFLWAKS